MTELAVFGLTLEDFKDDPSNIFYLLEENIEAFNLFSMMATQWNISHNGATGLNYASLAEMWSLLGIKKKRRKEVFQQMQIMEDAALGKMRGNQK